MAEAQPVRWLVDNGEDALCFENASQAEHYAEKWGFLVAPLYTSAPSIPEGWQLVPVEPTPRDGKGGC